MLSLLSLIMLVVCTIAALISRMERRRLERLLRDEDIIVYVHFEVEDEQAYPFDVTSRRAQALRDNANWN